MIRLSSALSILLATATPCAAAPGPSAAPAAGRKDVKPPDPLGRPTSRAAAPLLPPLNTPTVRRRASDKALTLDEVLRSVRKLHPKLAQARLKVIEARGALQAARGGFDPVLSGKGSWRPIGDYVSGEGLIGMRQPTPLWGLSVFGQWSISGGKFPFYEGDRVTSDGGIAKLGISLPLLNGGPIDKRRAKIEQSDAKRRSARFAVLGTQLELSRKAARAFWAWVAAGHKLRINQSLLQLAQTRDAQVAEGVRRGALPAIDRLDNKRAILGRKGRVVKAQRSFEKQTLKLSLFLRDNRGRTRRVDVAALPSFPPTSRANKGNSKTEVNRTITDALRRRPEFGVLVARRRQIDVDRRLADNQRLPKLTLAASGGLDFGSKPYLDQRGELKLGLSLQMPLLLRNARGRLASAQAGLKRIQEARRQLRDRVEAQVRDALSALRAAQQQVTLARQELRLARRLEQAERDRLRLGASTLLVVNIRERAAATAAGKLVDLRALYHQARADLQAVTGQLGGSAP
jgi:cobalt-zinc-cadmium efflux system outer membrane protein